MNEHRETKRDYWQRQFRRQQESGLSQRAYCRREGVSHSQFSYWRRKHEGASEVKSGHRLVEVPVKMAVSAAAMMEIVIAGGYVVRVHGAVCEEHLAGVLRAVESLR